MEKYSDYIVVGGGASGCAVAHKLLKSNNSVVLIEAGYSHHNFLLDVPAGFFKLVNERSIISKPQPLKASYCISFNVLGKYVWL